MSLRRGLLWVVLALSVSLGILTAVAWSIAGTGAGTAWLLRQAATFAQDGGVTLAYRQVHGSLLSGLEVQGLHYADGANRVTIDNLLLRLRLTTLLHGTLQVDTLHLQGTHVYPAATTSGEAAPLELPTLPLRVRVESLRAEQIAWVDGEQETRIGQVALSLVLDAQSWALRDLGVRLPGVILTGTATLQPDRDNALLGQLRVELDSAPLAGSRITVDLDGTLAAPVLKAAANLPHGKVDATLKINLAGREPAFEVTADTATFVLDTGDPALARLHAARLEAAGTAERYTFTARGGMDTRDGGDIPFAASGEGNAQGLLFQTLHLAPLGGTLEGTGRVDWHPHPSWAFTEIRARGIDPGRLAPEWPGKLDADAALRGELLGDEPAVQLRLARLAGQLQGLPLEATGAFRLKGRTLALGDVKARHGGNSILLNGTLNERKLDVVFELDAPALHNSHPRARGSVTGSGRVLGSPGAPVLTGSLNGRSLGFDGFKLEAIDLQADWSDTGGVARLAISSLTTGASRVDHVVLDLKGRPEAHTLAITAGAEGHSLALAADGSADATGWKGSLDRLTLSGPRTGDWRMDRQVPLTIGTAQGSIAPFCLARDKARLCANGGWQPSGEIAFDFGLRDLPLQSLPLPAEPGLPRLQGALDGKGSVRGTFAAPAIDIGLWVDQGVMHVQTDDEPLAIAFGELRLDLAMNGDSGTADMAFRLAAGGAARGKVRFGPAPARELQGEIQAGFPDLALVAGFVPGLDKVSGNLAGEMQLGGRLEEPRLQGRLRIQDGSARIPAAGITLTSIRMDIEGDGEHPLKVDAVASSGKGNLAVTGTVLAARQPALNLRITGSDVEVLNLVEARVNASPELTVSGSDPVRVEGHITIPEARIKLRSIPQTAVAVSGDEVLLGQPEAAPAAPRSQGVSAKLALVLGKDVRFSGFGLETRLEGKLESTIDRRRTRLNGAINLREGAFKAYGQDLNIEQGRLLFTGVPEHPGLDVRAYRESRDKSVRAYLAVSGPPDRITTRIYTVPTLPESEAIAYLTTGKGLSQASKSEGIDIANTALALGAAQGKTVLQKLGRDIGLDELRVESGAERIEESAVVLGKYLNPDLYIGYSQNLFDASGSVLMRAKLGRKVDIETRSGVEQSLDVIYRIEHD